MEKNKTSITSDIGMQFFDPRTQNILFSTDYETHEFHLPSGVKSLNVQKASTERVWFICFINGRELLSRVTKCVWGGGSFTDTVL